MTPLLSLKRYTLVDTYVIYDFNIKIVVEEINVTRDQIKTLEYIEERDIIDVSAAL